MSEIVERVIVNKEDLEELADSVRAAKNETGVYQWDALKTSAIEIIGSGPADPVLQEKTVTPTTASQNITPDSGYDGLASVTVNAMPTGSVGAPSISVDSSTGVITATAAVDAGYVDGTDTTGTLQLTTKTAQTITPGTTDQTIASGQYLIGTQTIKGDANLTAENIAEGVNIFGVAGTMEPKEFSIITTIESGANVTATKGSTTISGTSTGTCTLKVPTAGAWAVKATTTNNEYGEIETSDSKTVTTVDSYSTSLTFWRATLNVLTAEGVTITVTDGSKTYSKVAGSSAFVSFQILNKGTWTITGISGTNEESTTVAISNATTYIAEVLTPYPVDATLNNNDWDIIQRVSSKGIGANYWAVGDTKQVIINGTVGSTTFNNLSTWAFILGFDHNSDIEGSNTIHFQIGKTAQTSGTDICLSDSKYGSAVSSSTIGYFNMNYTSSNKNGWKSSKMRTVLLGNNNTPAFPYLAA